VDRFEADNDPKDPIKLLCMLQEWFAQELRFVPRQDGTSEDNG
jgi:hypothetical protein